MLQGKKDKKYKGKESDLCVEKLEHKGVFLCVTLLHLCVHWYVCNSVNWVLFMHMKSLFPKGNNSIKVK